MNPTIRAYAPGRLNLIGEHTDYNLGYALPIALQVGTVAEYTPDPAARDLTVVSDSEPGGVTIGLDTAPGDVGGWGAYVAGCVWALRTAGREVAGGRLHIGSDVPVGSGLSSSAALECAVLLALRARAERAGSAPGGGDDRHALARIAQRAENDYVGAPTGLLDQLASLYGRPDTALLIDFRSLAVTNVPVRLARDGADATLVVIDSKAPHRHAVGEYAARRGACEEAAARLGLPSLREAPADAWRSLRDEVIQRRARHVLTENERVLVAAEALRNGELEVLGRAMDASHASMRDDFEITTPGIDHIVDTARGMGALGARMTGGGFGGSVVAVVPTAVLGHLEARLPEVVEAAGFPRPTVRAVRPGAGAHVV
ncbi:galactokinase [Tsukamurella soli]|uniref:Galactokinase n=1 Tax=Tsukamurella soli TaxID=644556 RepID=A0ABP8K582_9ACTN